MRKATGSPAPAPLLNRVLDRAVRPEFALLGVRVSAFRLCGCTGLGVAFALAMALVARAGLSPAVMAGVTLAAVATFLALALVTKAVTGEERLIYYHHE